MSRILSLQGLPVQRLNVGDTNLATSVLSYKCQTGTHVVAAGQ